MTKFLIVIASLMVVATVIAHEEQNGDHGGATHPIIWARGARYIERYDAPTALNALYTINGHICSVVRVSGSGDSLTVTYEHPPRIVSPPRPPTPPPPQPATTAATTAATTTATTTAATTTARTRTPNTASASGRCSTRTTRQLSRHRLVRRLGGMANQHGGNRIE